jgi:hypothetical protein
MIMRLSALLLPHGNRFVPTLSACLLCYSSSYSLSAYLTVDDLSVGDLLITEVMANPAAVSDDAGEWFEIINTTNDEIDLNGLLLRDNGGDKHAVSRGMAPLLAAGAYFTFGRNGNADSNGGYQTDYTYRAFSLANNGDEIILETATTIIDSLFYSTSIFGAAGHSAELTVSGFSLTPSDWTYGSGDIGSPGAAGRYSPIIDTIDSSFDDDYQAVSVAEPAVSLLMLLGVSCLIAGRFKFNGLS